MGGIYLCLSFVGSHWRLEMGNKLPGDNVLMTGGVHGPLIILSFFTSSLFHAAASVRDQYESLSTRGR